MLSKFPVEVSIDGKRVGLIQNKEQYVDFINKYNGKMNLYQTIYTFEAFDGNKPYYETALVDSVFIDIDSKDSKTKKEIDIITEGKKLTEWLHKNQLLYNIYFSGRGLHVYIYVEPSYLNNKKVALRNFSLFIKAKLDVNIDMSVAGDISRIARIPNTINMRSGLYCIPITNDELKTVGYLQELAKHQRQMIKPQGLYLLKLTKFDSKSTSYNETKTNESFSDSDEINFEKFKEFVKDIPCIDDIISDNEAGYKQRTLFLSWCKHMGFTERESQNLLKSFLSKEKWNKSNCARGHAQKIFKYNYNLPSCKTILNLGLCPFKDVQEQKSKCKYYNNIKKTYTDGFINFMDNNNS